MLPSSASFALYAVNVPASSLKSLGLPQTVSTVDDWCLLDIEVAGGKLARISLHTGAGRGAKPLQAQAIDCCGAILLPLFIDLLTNLGKLQTKPAFEGWIPACPAVRVAGHC